MDIYREIIIRDSYDTGFGARQLANHSCLSAGGENVVAIDLIVRVVEKHLKEVSTVSYLIIATENTNGG